MAHLSGVFSSPFAGTLEVSLDGAFYANGRRDAGFPGNGGNATTPANALVRGFIGASGAPIYFQPIDRYAPFSGMSLQYPGGNVPWPYGTETLAFQDPTGATGFWSYGFQDLRLRLVLMKR
jgi:hypothetical protein